MTTERVSQADIFGLRKTIDGLMMDLDLVEKESEMTNQDMWACIMAGVMLALAFAVPFVILAVGLV
ncbi:hypothetical protein V19_01 [Brucella phage V_19]|uniref:Uncharacterized protein n=30 Tax=Perisivirus TaxID=1984798 RepID=H2EI38_9CAUD|nr:hypothetical protein [Brucella melitensis]YP_007002009.1 hypothetical protein F354_gp01 [Brucella phage Tb]YP_007002067.1 hypothetical protein F355_gp01 [Brucella phage Pr]AHB81061.1 hypothetical protein Bk_01 [Brucella phage Bk]AHB81117.1 hypothetical protein Fz_01 [Brucella phage Fz]AHB81175.1 hypothetical protein R/C_01 [Brucella phage R/C]AHB81231.1 hypothetical protein S708_01 [Brucella phage S708]AHB81345.1 hypothetical protein Wb_01 [Brucella phage Wb]AKO58989.1 hypothetical prote